MVCGDANSTKLLKHDFDHWMCGFHSRDYEESFHWDKSSCSHDVSDENIACTLRSKSKIRKNPECNRQQADGGDMFLRIVA
jgi:hypothetical protein